MGSCLRTLKAIGNAQIVRLRGVRDSFSQTDEEALHFGARWIGIFDRLIETSINIVSWITGNLFPDISRTASRRSLDTSGFEWAWPRASGPTAYAKASA